MLPWIKQQLFNTKNILPAFLYNICFIFGLVLSIFGLQELYKSHTFIIRQCQVKSINLKYMNKHLHPRWNITVLHENQMINTSLINPTGFTNKDEAWKAAHQYKINQIYPCYRSQEQTSVIQWDWQWKKPSILKGYGFFLTGALLLTTIVLAVLRHHYQKESRIIQSPQQNQIEMPSRIEVQQPTTLSLETPPPSYTEATRIFFP